jgi:hypothetical protein
MDRHAESKANWQTMFCSTLHCCLVATLYHCNNPVSLCLLAEVVRQLNVWTCSPFFTTGFQLRILLRDTHEKYPNQELIVKATHEENLETFF